jgi:orotate phosphoribosyltransferase
MSGPVGVLDLRPTPKRRLRAGLLGFDFYLPVHRKGDPTAAQVLAELQAARPPRKGHPARDLRAELTQTKRRLAILTDIVKTANSILEPRKVIESSGFHPGAHPSEAWPC